MKPFWGIDLTNSRRNTELNGKEFLVATTSDALSQSLEKSAEKAEETLEKAKSPLALRIIRYVCGVAGGLMILSLIRSLGSITLAQAYENAPWVFWILGICVPIWAVLTLAGKRKEKTVLEDEESVQILGNLEGMHKAVFAELAVPADAKTVDILSFYYKEKGEDLKVCEKAMQLWSHFNPEFRAYADEENLYLAGAEGKYAFPKTEIKGIRTVDKKVRMQSWNKDTDYKDSQYKEYRLARDNYGCIHCKKHCILEVERKGELYGIYFPAYELPVFEALIK